MPKRYLTVQNKGNDSDQQPQASATNTTARTSTKRASTNDPIPAKKAKTDVAHNDQENRPANTSPQPPISLINNPVLPILYGLGLLSRSAYDADADDDESDTDDSPIDTDDSFTSSSTDDIEFEDHNETPISTLADNLDNGEDHPRNKQYLVFRKSNTEDYVISKTARYWSLRYRKVLRHINPGLYGLYIHADFSCYGELEVVENCLRDLTRTLFFVQQGVVNVPQKSAEKVNYILGFRRLEALTILLNYTDGISGIDDGDRFYDIMRVIGACYVTILRGLLPKAMFEQMTTVDDNLVKRLRSLARQIPNFKHVLEQALIIGHGFLSIADVCSAYTKILQVCSQRIDDEGSNDAFVCMFRSSIAIGFFSWKIVRSTFNNHPMNRLGKL